MDLNEGQLGDVLFESNPPYSVLLTLHLGSDHPRTHTQAPVVPSHASAPTRSSRSHCIPPRISRLTHPPSKPRDSTVKAIFGSKCYRIEAGKPAALPAEAAVSGSGPTRAQICLSTRLQWNRCGEL